MSPVSRGRKKPKKKRQVRRKPGATPPNILAEVLGAWEPVAELPSALEAEVYGSMWLSTLAERDDGVTGVDPDPAMILELLEFASRQQTRTALVLAHTLSSVANSEDVRTAAADVATSITAAGIPEHPWGDQIGQPTPGRCWSLTDVFGDSVTVALEFSYGESRHALVCVVDFNHLGGWVQDAFTALDSEDALAMLRESEAATEGITTLAEADPAEMAALMYRGIKATDMTWQPSVEDTYPEYRALALARCRLFPGSSAAEVGGDFVEVSDDERGRIVAEFLSSEEASDLPDTAEYCASLIVSYGCDYDNGQPIRVSPVKLENFLLGWMPRKVVLEDDDREVLPAVVQAWVRWATARNQLPVAVDELTTDVDAMLDAVAEAFSDGAGPANEVAAELVGRGTDLSDRSAVEDDLRALNAERLARMLKE